MDSLQTLAATYIPQLLLALATLYVGWKLIGLALNMLDQGHGPQRG